MSTTPEELHAVILRGAFASIVKNIEFHGGSDNFEGNWADLPAEAKAKWVALANRLTLVVNSQMWKDSAPNETI